MRTLLFWTFLSLLAIPALPTTASASNAQEVFNDELKWLGLDSATVCDGLSAKASEIVGLRGTAWRENRGAFVNACNDNPTAPGLFPGLSKNEQGPRVKAYCEYNPVVRLCMVCGLLAGAAANLDASFGNCDKYLNADEPREDFVRNVLGQ